ncbi:binding-protein-dependent transport systems inner membrane component [Ancylobacter novellus DSM 506]|uniref:Binding-protein-dependent transport systems inner membrane component n=2 Tax=Ancylobacter novellus TaxID=921 RepID=D6ZZ81_ANCN5|nr:binding-protein-dependent transport systems inner membrane component [Ancylobacter novellus DSM 506]
MRRLASFFGEKERFMLALIAPAAITMALFQVVPIVLGANASFRDWTLYDPKKTWVGLKHYIEVITDPAFFGLAIPNTLLFLVLSVSLSLVCGLGLALLLNRNFVGQSVVRTIVLLPLMVAPVIASIMMRWMFNDQFGIVNVVLEGIGLPPVAWLAYRWTTMMVIVLADVWLWTPWFAVLLLAGLQSLPKEPFEAAAIDAAGRWRVFRSLTLPMLRPVIVVCVVIRSIDAFRVFDQVWVISGGGPARTTEMFSIYAYVEAFQRMNFGKGSAAALIGGVVIVIFGLVLYRLLNRAVEVSK